MSTSEAAERIGVEGQFRKLPIEFRDRLHELDGYELKVWLCYLLHANRSGVAWPSRGTIHRETGLSEDWISKARTSLSIGKKRGWLLPQGDVRSTGKFGCPRFRAVVPESNHADLTSSRCETDAVENHPDEGQADRAEVKQVHRAEVTSARSRFREVDEEKKSAPDVAAAFAFETYKQQFGDSPSWTTKDYAQAASLFSRKKDLTLEEFKRRWIFYLRSNYTFYASNGYSLALFCTKAFDALRSGPLDERGAVVANSGMGWREQERRRNELSPEGKRLYEQIGVRPQ